METNAVLERVFNTFGQSLTVTRGEETFTISAFVQGKGINLPEKLPTAAGYQPRTRQLLYTMSEIRFGDRVGDYTAESVTRHGEGDTVYFKAELVHERRGVL